MTDSTRHATVRRTTLFATLIGAAAAFAFLASTANHANAAQTFVVNRTDDPSPIMCGGSCSLREAVTAANGTPGPDAIQLQGGQTYTLSIPVGNGGVLAGDLDVSDDVTITTVGDGGNATIDGNGDVTSDRTLEITGGTTTLRNVDVVGGVGPTDGGNPPHHNGGGIQVDSGASLNVLDSNINGNSVPGLGDLGGGIFNNNGHVLLQRSMVAGNRASGGFGGGIDTVGPNAETSILNSKLFDNDGFAGGGFAAGGGETEVFNSQLSFNSSGDGGAAFVGNGSVNFTNATINNNRTDTMGGALRATGGSTTFKNSTISDNVAGDESGGISAKDLNNGGTITFTDTIIAGNIDGDPSDGMHPDCSDQTGGLILTLGFNIVGNGAGCGLTPMSGDHIGTPGAPVNPGLAPGTSYTGGPGTGLTWSLLQGSLAMDAGNPTNGACAPEDARGVPRTLGGRCDIGAWEFVTCGNKVVDRNGDAADNTSDEKSLSPTDQDDGMVGLAGNDSLRGGAGNDAMCGGKGSDTLRGGAGNDMLIGGKGHDVCKGGPGHDTAKGCEVERSIP
jgi:CSLREA domain-containing protein